MKRLHKWTLLFFLLLVYVTSGQSLRGTIKHFPNRSFGLYAIVGDTLVLLDSIRTDQRGQFRYTLPSVNNFYNYLRYLGLHVPDYVMLRIQLHPLQYTDVLVKSYYNPSIASSTIETRQKYHPDDVVIHLVYRPSQWDNWARDSANVEFSTLNTEMYRFLKHYKKVQVAEGWLLEMSRLFPQSDEFSPVMINEYFKRHRTMQNYMKSLLKQPDSPQKRIILAHYRPVLPDFKTPDGLRFDTIRAHFWDYYNPNDPIFGFSTILIDKLEEWVYLHHHHKDSIAGLYLEKQDIVNAINSYLERIQYNEQNRMFVLTYALKKLDRYEDKSLFLQVYDRWLKPTDDHSGDTTDRWQPIHQKASIYRNIVKGAKAPDFLMKLGNNEDSLNLYGIQSDYTLLFFWASWCPHCTREIPNILKQIENWRLVHPDKILTVVAISLDTDYDKWYQTVSTNNLWEWLHYSELKGWDGEIHKLYNVYATPTFYMLDENKKIIEHAHFIEKVMYAIWDFSRLEKK